LASLNSPRSVERAAAANRNAVSERIGRVISEPFQQVAGIDRS
jgi:hypothetical protein